MALSWSFSLKTLNLLIGIVFCLASGARRVLVSNKNTCYLPSHRSCFIHLNHPRHLVPGWLEVDGVSEVAADWWYHTRGNPLNGFPFNGISGDGIVFVVGTYQGEGDILFQDARRGLAMFSRLHVFLASNFFFLNVLGLFPFGNNKI